VKYSVKFHQQRLVGIHDKRFKLSVLISRWRVRIRLVKFTVLMLVALNCQLIRQKINLAYWDLDFSGTAVSKMDYPLEFELLGK
jgi:hypothetical protein